MEKNQQLFRIAAIKFGSVEMNRSIHIVANKRKGGLHTEQGRFPCADNRPRRVCYAIASYLIVPSLSTSFDDLFMSTIPQQQFSNVNRLRIGWGRGFDGSGGNRQASLKRPWRVGRWDNGYVSTLFISLSNMLLSPTAFWFESFINGGIQSIPSIPTRSSSKRKAINRFPKRRDLHDSHQ